MMVINELEEPAGGLISPLRVKMRMLGQMAEALEDQVAALYRRAAAFEEEEFLLNREIEERQTEINRMTLKLDAIRAERDRVTERIESISREAVALREEAFNGEEEVALASLERSATSGSATGRSSADEDTPPGATFFRRVMLAEAVTQRLG